MLLFPFIKELNSDQIQKKEKDLMFTEQSNVVKSNEFCYQALILGFCASLGLSVIVM